VGAQVKDGVVKLEVPSSSGKKDKALVHTESGQVVSSYESLESMLAALDWERYYGDDALLQFHKCGSLDTISLPKDFGSAHMYDIVLKNRDAFRVVNNAASS
jgi:hypothetical protein